MTSQHNTTDNAQAIIVGAGTSGLALAYYLLKQGIKPLVLDAGAEIASSWRTRHPQLSLNTHRLLSNLPGMKIPRQRGTFVSRDDYIEYLEKYTDELRSKYQLRILFNQKVESIQSRPEGWLVSSKTDQFMAPQLVIATGPDNTPFLPQWPGHEDFSGKITHAGKFGDISQYDGKKVLIVGGANSGIDIANHLIRRNRFNSLAISMRHGAHLMPTYIAGLSSQLSGPLLAKLPVPLQDKVAHLLSILCFGDLEKYGIKTPTPGLGSRLAKSGIAPGFDNGFVKAVKNEDIDVLPEIERLTASGVVFKNGDKRSIEHIICATGYRHGLETLLPKGFLGSIGLDKSEQGLTVFGMVPKLQGSLYARKKEAKVLAKRLANSLRKQSAYPLEAPTS